MAGNVMFNIVLSGIEIPKRLAITRGTMKINASVLRSRANCIIVLCAIVNMLCISVHPPVSNKIEKGVFKIGIGFPSRGAKFRRRPASNDSTFPHKGQFLAMSGIIHGMTGDDKRRAAFS